MEKVRLTQYMPGTRSSGAGTVVFLSDYRRVSHRLGRLLKHRKSSCIWASIGIVLLAVMTLGALSDSAGLKGIAWFSFGIAFFLITPFSWWLNSTSHR